MPTDRTRITIELPRELRDRIRNQAAAEERTMIAVISRALDLYIYHQAKGNQP